MALRAVASFLPWFQFHNPHETLLFQCCTTELTYLSKGKMEKKEKTESLAESFFLHKRVIVVMPIWWLWRVWTSVVLTCETMKECIMVFCMIVFQFHVKRENKCRTESDSWPLQRDGDYMYSTSDCRYPTRRLQSISENHIVQCDVYIIYKDTRCRIYLNTIYSIRVVLLSLDYI